MSENNQFELLMQQKMDGFLVEPAPSDWQAIYDRLHPRNKRRIIWWWFPLIAALGAGIFWTYSSNEQVSVVAAKTALQTDSKADHQIVPINPGEKDSLSTVAAITTASARKGINHTPGNSDNKSAKPRSTEHTSVNMSAMAPETKLLHQTSVSTNTRATENQSPDQASAKANARKSEINAQQKNNTATPNNLQHPSTDQEIIAGRTSENKTQLENNSLPLPVTQTSENAGGIEAKTTGAVTEAQKPLIKNEPTDENKEVPAAQTSSIPVKSKDHQWQWAGYIGAGPSYPSDPLTLGPRALAANTPTSSSGGGSRTYTTNSRENGWHIAGGIMAEKKLGNKWLFSAGFGINSSTWITKSEKFKDSIFNGALSSTVKLSSEQHKNQLWMAEIPLQFSNRISGKKAGSLWWTVGINNQFRISLNQNTTKASSSTASLSDRRSITSSSRFYQPQFRAGLLYNHSGMVHWQIQPLFQYSLTGVYTPDIPDNTVLANLQLQYRLFLQGKKAGKKAKK